jgi:hypothetical protein
MKCSHLHTEYAHNQLKVCPQCSLPLTNPSGRTSFEERKPGLEWLVKHDAYVTLSLCLKIFINGETDIVVQNGAFTARSKSTDIAIPSLAVWTECFNTYVLLYVSVFPKKPEKVADMLRYSAHICALASRNVWSSVRDYDEKNRRKLAGTGANWSDRVDDVLRVECLIPLPRHELKTFSTTSDSPYSRRKRDRKRPRPKDSPKGKGCHNVSGGRSCSRGADCKHSHECPRCHSTKPHVWKKCKG